jgi:hypothetical protein
VARKTWIVARKTGVAESVYETVSESLVALFSIRRNHSVIQQRLSTLMLG